MTDRAHSKQLQILRLLLEHKEGLSINQVSKAADISRNAVQQHFATLIKNGHIRIGRIEKTAGRPVRSFTLTEAGINSFPKQYAWFSTLILADLKAEMGTDAFLRYLHKLGISLSQQLEPRLSGKNDTESVIELVAIMNELGFQASIAASSEQRPTAIEACNCIYHDLAQQHIEVCEFDRALISTLLNKEIKHVECMAQGGGVCRFNITESKQSRRQETRQD